MIKLWYRLTRCSRKGHTLVFRTCVWCDKTISGA